MTDAQKRVGSVVSNATVSSRKPSIWWTNGAFFIGTHLAALAGVMYRPPWTVSAYSLLLALVSWQAASFGITIGYHRLYSHRAFRARLSVRVVLAALGATAFQGSIKWWCLRHRLHHRFTDDPIHDPYAATRGLLFSHMGWIFFKPKYDRMASIDREDLLRDPVVVFQHKYYVPLALFFGFIAPALLGRLWGDPLGAYIWGGLVARIITWHCTFLVNSLAHWNGLQPYSDENTSRGNLIMALLTGGEGNHNFHAFPHDYRSGPSRLDWDPSKWIISLLQRAGLVYRLRRARQDDIHNAKLWMHHKHHNHNSDASDESSSFSELNSSADEWEGEIWSSKKLAEYLNSLRGKDRCLLVLDGFLVDATNYLGDHPGGSALLRQYAIHTRDAVEGSDVSDVSENLEWRDGDWAFYGGLNNHSRLAKERMRSMRVALLDAGDHE